MGAVNDFPEVYWRDYDRFSPHPLRDGSYLLTETEVQASGLRSQRWLALPTGLVVAFMETWAPDPAQLWLCAVEVREPYRGAGLLREFVAAVEEQDHERLAVAGAFTASGLRALAFLPLAPGARPVARFNSMSFVKNWDLLIPVSKLATAR